MLKVLNVEYSGTSRRSFVWFVLHLFRKEVLEVLGLCERRISTLTKKGKRYFDLTLTLTNKEKKYFDLVSKIRG